jgi:protein NDRG1
MRRTSQDSTYRRMSQDAIRKRSSEWVRRGSMEVSKLGAKHIVPTERCGPLSVYVQGDLSQQDKRAIFLTVHDLGCNHTSFHDFVEHPTMCEIKERSVFIHVDIPGQEDNATDLADDFQFPTMQMIGEDLVTVLDFLHIKYVIGLGEGAGANILLRFGMAHASRCLGLILVNVTAGKTSVMDYFKDKFRNWKLGQVGHNPTTEQYLVFHKFGHQLAAENDDVLKDREKTILDYQAKLRSAINAKNLKRYVDAFLSRKDITGQLEKNLKIDTLLLAGTKGSYGSTVQQLHTMMDKQKTQLLKIDDVGDVVNEAPEKVAQSILLFCKGQGLLTSVAMPGVERQRTISGGEGDAPNLNRQRTMSMEEYDKPNIRRLSITAIQQKPGE